MYRPLRMLLCGSGFLVLSLCAQAQSSRQDPYYPQRYDEDRYSRQRGYGNRDSLINRVLSDLDAAAYNGRLDDHERKHFEKATQKLQEFEERWARGRFDNGKLDEAIENLDHLAHADRVSGRDRYRLSRDLQDLRQFRSSGDSRWR
jgi:hypothetical protein